VKIYNRRAITVDEIAEGLMPLAETLRPYVTDTSLVLNQALDAGKLVCLEGSQGTLLDVDHGTYPFVTSSNPTAGGACSGSGIGPTRIDRVCGISRPTPPGWAPVRSPPSSWTSSASSCARSATNAA